MTKIKKEQVRGMQVSHHQQQQRCSIVPICFVFAMIALFCIHEFLFDTKVVLNFSDPEAVSTLCSQDDFNQINEQLIGPDAFKGNYCDYCGCPERAIDCPRWYEPSDILASAKYQDEYHDKLVPAVSSRLEARKSEAATACKSRGLLKSGGWCLTPADNGTFVQYEGYKYQIPRGHLPPSQQVFNTLSAFIEKEGIKSINDFGAGVGQYKAAFLKKFPDLRYNAYDGAGNIEQYTSGFVKFFDLTLPLIFPKADWLFTFEVGEHVPSAFEGMMLRNINAHACKGVILSWGVLGQGGVGHINNHGNDYLRNTFHEMNFTSDYAMEEELRKPENNYPFFTRSIMVFRRNDPVC